MTKVTNNEEFGDHGEARWFVVNTHPRQEKLALVNLQRQGYRVLFPSLKLQKRRRGKWQPVVEAMFPGYLFVELTLGKDDPAPIRSTLGCIRLVSFGPVPQPVPSAVILPIIELGDAPAEAVPQLKPGDKVRIEDGPLKSLYGIYKLPKGEDRAQVLLNLLGRNSQIIVELNQISRED